MRSVITALFFLILGAASASAHWRYAEWGMTPTQIAAASHGQANSCQVERAACAGGAGLAIDSTQMLGMTATVAFFFDPQGQLNRTVVTFQDADFGLIAGLLQGIHGPPVTDQPGSPPTRVYRDTQRGSTITLIGTRPVTMSYRPGNP
jgi:hypothetical protein